MLQTEFVKNLNNNYERIRLDEKPQEKKYQYCILIRGGIKGLLSCSLRYINGEAYLYYDITSRQSVEKLFQKRIISRDWLKNFLWSFRQIKQELERFLLSEENVLWFPEHIYQDLESSLFSFLYMPYYKGENGFSALLEFLVEHIDYEDDVLVECVYKIYEQYEDKGADYLQRQIFEDAEMLDKSLTENTAKGNSEGMSGEENFITGEVVQKPLLEQTFNEVVPNLKEENSGKDKKGILAFFGHKKVKTKEKARGKNYQQEIQISMEGMAVAEEPDYEEEDYGRTVYIEEPKAKKDPIRRLYTEDGKLLIKLDMDVLVIGKKKEEVDLVLDDSSISRMHARILREGEDYYLEDINSTNGTFKNGLRLEPYERRKLQEGDEILLGKICLIFQ